MVVNNRILFFLTSLIVALAGYIFWIEISIVESKYLATLSYCGILTLLVTIFFNSLYLPLLLTLILIPGKSRIFFDFNLWMLFALAVIVVWLLQTCIQQTPTKNEVKGKATLLLVIGYSSIVILHFLFNKIGIGTGSEGGLYIFTALFLGCIICYLIQSERLDTSQIGNIPFLALVISLFEVILEIAIWINPETLVYIKLIYADLNWEALEHFEGVREVTHHSGFRTFGLALGLFCCVHLTTIGKHQLFRIQLLLVGVTTSIGIVLYAGYRVFLLSLLVTIFLTTIVRFRSRIWLLVIALSILFSALIFYHNQVKPLPYSLQRSLSWIPSNWDQEIKNEVDDGWRYRSLIWNTFLEEVYPARPFFGSGRRYFPESAPPEGSISQEREFALYTQLLHSGFFGALDFVGLVGLFLIIAVTLRAYYNCYILFRFLPDKLNNGMYWIIYYFLSAQPYFWLTGNFEKQIGPISLCICTIEFLRHNSEKTPKIIA